MAHNTFGMTARARAVSRQRGIFPLPVPSPHSSGCVGGRTSRSVTRRKLSELHVERWVRDMVITLNCLYSGDEGKGNFDGTSGRPTAAQSCCLDRLYGAVRAVGKPPPGLDGPGAFNELRARQGYATEPATLAPLSVDLVSLPSPGSIPSPLERILGGEAVKVERVLSSKLLTRARAAENAASSGLKSPYYDPLIKHNKRLYADLIRKLHDAGVVEFRRSCREHVGIFTVWKKSGKQRLVVDARLTNCWFEPPEGVRLATGSSFGHLEVDGGPPIALGGVDIADAFYQIALPQELRDLFGLLPVRAEMLGITATVEGPVSGGEKVIPVFKAIPMGWTQALWVCQHCHESVVNGLPGFGNHNRLVDNKIPPDMQPYIHTEYVDNFVCLSQDPVVAHDMAKRVDVALQERGLPTHDVEASVGGCTLGWEFSDHEPAVHLSRVRLWKYRLGLLELLKRGRCSSRTLERVVGHLTFAGLVRREFLSIFQASYVYIRKGLGEQSQLWESVARELRWACSLLPLLHRDLGMGWSEDVSATDASFWGRGVTVTRRSRDMVKCVGQFNERWRFSADEEASVHMGSHPDTNLTTAEVPVEFVGSDWRQVDGAKWDREEAIPILEGRALIWLGQHLARSRKQHGKKHLILTDSMSAILALNKGRSSAGTMNRVCRQHAALMFATGMFFSLRWVPSELNPADRPSRGKPLGDFDAVIAAKQWAQFHAEKGLKTSTKSWRDRAFDAVKLFASEGVASGDCRTPSADSKESCQGQSAESPACDRKVRQVSLSESQGNNLPGAPECLSGSGAELPERSGALGSVASGEQVSTGLAGRHCDSPGLHRCLSRGALLGRGRHVRSGNRGLGPQVLQPVTASTEIPVKGQQSHPRLSKVGPDHRESGDPVAHALLRSQLVRPEQQATLGALGCSHVGADVPSGGVPEAQMGACGEAVQNEQASRSSSTPAVLGTKACGPPKSESSTKL